MICAGLGLVGCGDQTRTPGGSVSTSADPTPAATTESARPADASTTATEPAVATQATTPPVAASPSAGSPTSSPAAAAASAPPATGPKDEVKLMKEYWEGTRNLKFTYELRKSANGKWERNGLARAYYSDGKLEREGHYKDGKRVGTWTYYDEAGNVRTGEPAAAGGSGATPR
jgi:hypothetical protein